MVRLSEIFHWMSEDERWRYKFLFQALILLVPVIGFVALLGWMAITSENLRAGRQDVAPAGFHLRRGIRPFVLGVVYWIGLGVPLMALRSLPPAWAGVLHADTVAAAYNDVALLLYVVLIVPMLVAADRGGLLAGLDLVHIALAMAQRPWRTLLATGVVLLAIVIAILGFAVIVAAPFTITYAGCVVATIAAWWAAPRRERTPGQGRTAAGRPVPFRPPGVEPESGQPADA